MRRGLWVVPVVLLVLLGGSRLVDVRVDSPDRGRLSAAGQARHRAQCHGLGRSDVRGDRPTYTRKRLATFRNSRSACHGIWLPPPRRYLVPQGIAATGNTAWISGFRYRQGYGERPCQLVRVDLVTGRRLAFHPSIWGRVGQRPRTYCRHGGGIAQRGRALWVVEKNKLWLVDPDQRSRGLQARRAWRIKSPVRGSAVVATARRIGLVPYQRSGTPRVYWFDVRKLFARGVLDLAVHGRGRRQVGATRSARVPRLVQGATLGPSGRLYLTRSKLSCGELVTPGGRRLGFLPGAEGIQIQQGRRRLWAVSESGARPYVVSRKPLTPAVSSYEWPRLLRGKGADCGFARF